MKILACLFAVFFSQMAVCQSLTQSDAQARAKIISDVKYDLDVSILKNQDAYTGNIVLHFKLKQVDDVRIDFKHGEVKEIKINGIINNDYKKTDQALYLKAKHFSTGDQSVSISYSQKFNTQGVGLHKFLDQEDQNQYFYTQFEPNDASRFIPCFDQPDIKATFKLNVTTEPQWEVISAKREVKKSKLTSQLIKWEFPESAPMSTYVFSLHVGPYTQWSDQYNKIKLRLFARKSMSRYVDHKEWFTVTKQGLSFFEKYFNSPYPFEKYDQLIVPEFNFGAMENVAAVTFSENFVSRGTKTMDQNEHAANVILHEMAHMWFGNLVTMRWWNDLWLNESFATYMAAKAVTDSTRYKNSWLSFYLGDKAWAYYSDELSTTHPIEANIPSADDAFNNFDGITYGKGASIMKQLAYYIGEDNFRLALENYFKKYAYKNTVLDDLLNEFEAAVKQNNKNFDVDLQKWKKDWLQTKGVDTIESSFTCINGLLDKVNLKLIPAATSNKKVHATEVALYKLQDRKLKLTHKFSLALNDNITASEKNTPCPDVVFPNYKDYGYFKLKLDEKSISNIKKYTSLIEDPFARLMNWVSLWQMVRDSHLSIFEYLAFTEDNFEKENDFKILDIISKQLSGRNYHTKNNILFFHPTETRNDLLQKSKLNSKIEKLYLTKLSKSKMGSDDQKLWFEAYLNVANSPEGQQKLINWLEGKWNVQGLKADPELRWKALGKLCEKDHGKAKSLLVKEQKVDHSDRAKKSVLQCEASFSDIENKRKWWNEIVNEKSSHSFSNKKSLLKGIFPVEQRPFLSKFFAQDYFTILKDTGTERSEHFLSDFSQWAGPDACIAEYRKLYSDFLQQQKNISPIVIKELQEVVDDGLRCEKIRTKAKTIQHSL